MLHNATVTHIARTTQHYKSNIAKGKTFSYVTKVLDEQILPTKECHIIFTHAHKHHKNLLKESIHNEI